MQAEQEHSMSGVCELQPEDLRVLEGRAGVHGTHQPQESAGGQARIHTSAAKTGSG